MKLSDQEQVILKAIGHVGRDGLAEISKVVRAIGYPKATTKKVLVALAEKGIVSLHRHDYPQSLTPAQRKLLVRLKGGYYSAVSVMKRNPKGKHLAGATAKQQRQYEHILESAKEYGRYGKRKKEVAARTVRARAKNKSGKGKEALKTTGRALKKAASSVLGAGSQILGAGSKALNPKRRVKAKKKRAGRHASRAIHSAKAPKTRRARASSAGRKAAKKTSIRSVAKTRKATTSRPAGRSIKKSSGLLKKRNSKTGEPIRITSDQLAAYNAGFRDLMRAASQTGTINISPAPALMRQWGHEKYYRRGWNDAKIGESGKHRYQKNPQRNPTRKGMRKLYREAKRISKITRGRYFSSELGQRKAARHEKRHARKSKLNPSAESIRKNFAGSISGHRELYFPQGTPQGLAKLGKLISITTEEGTIKPVHGSAWLCADTKERLHIGSTSPNPLFDGPKRSFGKVSKVEYEGAKPHLGYKGPIIWFHHMGEESGHRPTLHADGQGGLVFKGGRYRLTRRGIEN